jgi:hypothetical protein
MTQAKYVVRNLVQLGVASKAPKNLFTDAFGA